LHIPRAAALGDEEDKKKIRGRHTAVERRENKNGNGAVSFVSTALSSEIANESVILFSETLTSFQSFAC